MWSTHAIEYDSALKRMEILILATTWMSLEDIVLSEISHKMTNTVQFSPCVIPGAVKFTNTESRIQVSRGWREWGGMGSDCFMVQSFCLVCFFFNKFILFLAAMGLHCCAGFSCGERGLLFVAVRGLLTAVASLVAEHGL